MRERAAMATLEQVFQQQLVGMQQLNNQMQQQQQQQLMHFVAQLAQQATAFSANAASGGRMTDLTDLCDLGGSPTFSGEDDKCRKWMAKRAHSLLPRTTRVFRGSVAQKS